MQPELIRRTLLFKFGDRSVSFGPEEYYLITGLTFGGVDDLPRDSDIHRNVFGSRQNLYLVDIEKAFMAHKQSSHGGGELMLKLALLWFMFGALFCRHRSHKKISIKYMHLVDNIQRFNEYPWGLKSYEFFVKKLYASREKMAGTLINKRAAFDVNGLVFVLQVWLFETIPGLGVFCARRVDGYDHIWPRLMRWLGTPVSKTYFALEMFFTPVYITQAVSLNHFNYMFHHLIFIVIMVLVTIAYINLGKNEPLC